MVGQEHRPGGADDPGDHRQHGGQRNDGDLPTKGAATDGVRDKQADDPGAGGPGAADPDDRPLVAGHGGSSRRRLPPVADAPDRDQPLGHRRVALDLLAQAPDVHGDREWSPNVQPHTCWSRSSRENATPGWASRKRSRSYSRAVSASTLPARRGLVPRQVDDQVAVLEPAVVGLAALAGTPQHRLDPQHQLARAERLGHVVVRTALQSDDAVGLGARAPSA